MRMIVTGSRKWADHRLIEQYVVQTSVMRAPLTVLHGAAAGADRMAARVCASYGIPVEAYPADWKTNGDRAGLIRNQQMLGHRPNFVLAFKDDFIEDMSRGGTEHMCRIALQAGLRVVLIQHDRKPRQLHLPKKGH